MVTCSSKHDYKNNCHVHAFITCLKSKKYEMLRFYSKETTTD